MEAIFNYIYSLLTSDTVLKTLSGGSVRLYQVQAKKNPEAPYIVQRLETKETDAPYPLRDGTLIIDLWDVSTNAERILDMKVRVSNLLEQLSFTTTNEHVRTWLFSEGFIPDDIWHYVCQFSMRIYRTEV